jgi:triosephosphate isomerase
MKPLIVANWKANKGLKETVEWLKQARGKLEETLGLEVILCPSHVCLSAAFNLLEGSSIKLGAQDVSVFEQGAYTGENTVLMLKDLVGYVIIGHSERRKNFGETNEIVLKKAELAIRHNLVPLICLETLDQVKNLAFLDRLLTKKATFVYEPAFAIGTGVPDTPENANEIASQICQVVDEEVRVLYGGSVDEKNISYFLKQPFLKGVLVGKASLDPHQFCQLVSSASLATMVK